MFGLFSKRFSRRNDQADAAPRVPDGQRVYVVGDIHGRLDLLQELGEQIAGELAETPQLAATTVFLGDYVDRGPHSAGVLEALATDSFATPTIALRGNHEEVMLRFLEDESVLESWRKFGGLETLHSYGVAVGEAMRGEGYQQARSDLLRVLPANHRHFLETTKASLALGDYYFCHAGVRPGIPLESQVSDDLLWIREDFLHHKGAYGKMVVHGHTPVEAPDVRLNRINIDTGAYASSRLTALVLEGADRRFLATRRKR